MKKTILVGALAILLCVASGCQNKAEKAELEKFRAQAKPEEKIMDSIGLKPGGTLAIVLDDPGKSGGESARSATWEEFLAQVDKAGYKVEKEETFLQRDGLYFLRLK